MKKYNKPEIKITFLNNEEVLMVSGGIAFSKFSSDKKYTEINFK